MRYSHSRIETFKQCPLKFKFNYIEKPDIEKTNSIEAFMGSKVHSTLEKLYKDLKFSKLNSLEELLAYYNEIWNKDYNDLIKVVKKQYTPENYKDLGKKYITNYYNKYKPFNQGRTLGIELQVNIKLYNSDTKKTYNIIGYIDRLTIVGEDHIEIHDYKTNSTPKTQPELDKDRQLPLYSIAVKEMYPFVKKIDLVWHFLAPDIEMRSKRTDLELDDLKKEILDSISKIEFAQEQNNFPAKESALCNWCSFKSICPMKIHEIKTKKLSKDEFLEDDGVKLVDKYLKLITEKKKYNDEVDGDIEKLKQAIIVYSIKNNLEKLMGSNKSLLVKCYDSLKLPLKGTEQREELNKIIKDKGLWEDLSNLSVLELSKYLNTGMFSKEFLQELYRFIEKRKIYKLYINKK